MKGKFILIIIFSLNLSAGIVDELVESLGMDKKK